MPSVFSSIIAGEIPGRFVYQGENVVAFLTIAPVTPGHTLVVPREEIDQWTDLPSELLAELMEVAQKVGQAQKRVLGAQRVGTMIAGFEVPHVHVHVFPASSMQDFDLAQVDHDPDLGEQDRIAEQLAASLSD